MMPTMMAEVEHLWLKDEMLSGWRDSTKLALRGSGGYGSVYESMSTDVRGIEV